MTGEKDINERNREFWEEENRKFQERITKRPHDLKHVVDKTHERIEDGAFKKVRGLESQMAELDRLRSADQSARAQGPRTRARGHREIVTDAMRRALSQQMSYKEFMAAGEEDAWEGIEIEIVAGDGPMSYRVYCGILEPREESNPLKAKEAETEVFSDKTIQGWWTKAKLPKS